MKRIFSFLFFVFVTVLPLSAQNTNYDDAPTNTPIKLETENDALTQALKLAGFKEFMSIGTSRSSAENCVKKIIIDRDSTPYLNDRIEGRELWQVTLDDVDIRTPFARHEGYDIWKKRTFKVLLDINTGQLLKIYSLPQSEDSICTLSLTAEETATELLANTGERYHGFPSESPNITFLEALNAAAGCTPLKANEIIGQYIMYSRHGQDPVPVWCITTLGVPPIDFTSNREKSLIKSDNLLLDCERCIVDAMTGEWLLMVNVPCTPPQKTGE